MSLNALVSSRRCLRALYIVPLFIVFGSLALYQLLLAPPPSQLLMPVETKRDLPNITLWMPVECSWEHDYVPDHLIRPIVGEGKP